MSEYDDKILIDYLENQLDNVTRRQIDAVLAHDSALKQRLQALTEGPDLFKQAFAATLSTALPPGPMNTIMAAQMPKPTKTTPVRFTWTRFTWAIAASLAFLVIGSGLGYFLRPLAPPSLNTLASIEQIDWVDAVAAYQALYERGTLEHISGSGSSADLERVWKILDQHFELPDLTAMGLELKRAQPLRYGDRPLIQIAYLPNQGKPIAYCIHPINESDSEPASGRSLGLNFVEWKRNGFGHVVIGEADTDYLQQMASLIYKNS